MGFFSRKNSNQQEGEQKPARQHLSVRDLEAKAYARWVSEGSAEGTAREHAERKSHSFEAERARRRSLNEDVALVART